MQSECPNRYPNRRTTPEQRANAARGLTTRAERSNGMATPHVSRRDHTGRTFGLWTVLGLAYVRDGTSYWLCRCACGTERVKASGSLYECASRSCGCEWAAHMRKHGQAAKRTPEYRA